MTLARVPVLTELIFGYYDALLESRNPAHTETATHYMNNYRKMQFKKKRNKSVI